MRTDKRANQRADKKAPSRVFKRGVVGYSKKNALLEEAITHMNTGKYGRSSAVLKDLLALDPHNTEARRLFATLHLRLGSLVTARQAFESLANEAIGRQDYWLAESLLREYLAAGPRCVPFLEQLAHVYQEKGDEMAAVGELGKAIEILRDDPDADNPQKAAQLYSKIRELAPASPVAFQLAPLFDVQTGEFLVSPPVPCFLVADEAEVSVEDAPAPVETSVPEVMPWEVTDESHSVSPQEPTSSEVSAPVDSFASSTDQEPPASVSPDESQLLSALAPNAAVDESSISLPRMATNASVEPIDGPVGTLAVSESQSHEPPNLSSPMPWEEMADSSVQIEEPEVRPPADPFRTLESILVSLRTEVKSDMGPVAAENERAPALETGDPAAMTCSIEFTDLSAPLPSPMPWEQVSDPSMQIVASEPEPLSSQELLPDSSMPAEETLASSSLMESSPATTAPTAGMELALAPMDSDGSPASPTPSAGEEPAPASFSWNSVFDRAWKLTASTIASNSPISPEKEDGERKQPQQPEEHASLALSEAHSPAVESATVVVPPLSEEAFSPPVAPPEPQASFTIVEEDLISEAPPEQLPGESASISPHVEHASHWNTGEVAVQVHRPSKKKKRWEKEPEEAEHIAAPPTAPIESSSDATPDEKREWRTTNSDAAPAVDDVVPSLADVRPDWMQATDTITFDKPAAPASVGWSDGQAIAPSVSMPAQSAAASAVDVLFSPDGTLEEVRPSLLWSKPRPRFIARLHRIRIGVSSFIGSCFSTTRSFTFLVLLITTATVVVMAAGVGALGVTWMMMEEQPTQIYHTLTTAPPRTIMDAKKNGYLFLLGFDAPAGRDPLQAGYERKTEDRDRAAAEACMGGDGGKDEAGGASGRVAKAWIRSGDLLSQIKGQSGTIRSLLSGESVALGRYQQWLSMSFDDWGFGQLLSPNCAHVLHAHRLFLLEGFNQDLPTGLDRLETDLQSWRTALGQSKTLTMKMLAVSAVQDDASVVSGLLSRVDLDGAALARLSKMVRPLDQVELSVRWPMQSQFVWATKAVSSELKEDPSRDRPWQASLAASMRLPVQRRANAYAEYYDAANKAVASGRFLNLPNLSGFVRNPATGLMDYLANPIEHLVGLEPLPSWNPYVMRMTEADAQLRLAGLQAWIRRGPLEGNVLTRLAKAGQGYYDPFTGLPMLVNQRKSIIYSVGRDGKDQEGDPVYDVVVTIPAVSTSESRRPPVSSFQ